MFSFTKKRVLTTLSVVGIIAITAVAFAYWTTSGSGSGSATAGSDVGVSVAGDPADGIYPGGSAAVTTTITNDSATQKQFVSNLHVDISTSDTGCLASWFTYKADAEAAGTDSNPHVVALNDELDPSEVKSVAGTVYMSDPNVNQDDCKGAEITLDYEVNNTP